MTRPLNRWLLLLGVTLLAACASPSPADYAAKTPVLDLRRYFDGELSAHGLFVDRFGRVQKRFTVRLVGRWQGDNGVLEEDFRYDDGSTERRVWQLRHLGADNGVVRYSGQADDVLGSAIGEAAGNALRWRYTLLLPVDGRMVEVQFDDWMFLVDERVMLNRASMSKFGVHLGDVLLSFEKKG
jgi:hypothetical protein